MHTLGAARPRTDVIVDTLAMDSLTLLSANVSHQYYKRLRTSTTHTMTKLQTQSAFTPKASKPPCARQSLACLWCDMLVVNTWNTRPIGASAAEDIVRARRLDHETRQVTSKQHNRCRPWLIRQRALTRRETNLADAEKQTPRNVVLP